MGKYTFEYGALNDLAQEFLEMDEALKEEIKDTATLIGKNLRANTEGILAEHNLKEPKHGKHLADEVKMSVSVTDKRATITVKGGKQTGGFWWTVDNGHVAQNGRFIQGIHFTDSAYQRTEVEAPVDRMIQKVVGNG